MKFQNEEKFVTIIIPCKNEEKYISGCLESILENNYPEDRIEILVIDGMSTDKTREIIQSYTEKFPFIQMIDNPKGIVPPAMNIGIKESRGEIIIRMDAHATYENDYILQCVYLLQNTDAYNVGGLQRAVGTDFKTNGISIAQSHPFGIGNAYYRYSDKEMYVDTVFLGAWKKETLEKLGGFNEELVRSQDSELNYRIKKSGGKILLSPKIKSHYFVRDSITKLSKQYFSNGLWKVKIMAGQPDSVRIRQLIPPLFVFALIISFALMPFFWYLGILVPVIYLFANLLISFKISIDKGLKYFPLLMILFPILHFSWGIGFFFGIRKFGIPKIGLRQIKNSL